MKVQLKHFWTSISCLGVLLASFISSPACGPMLYSDQARFSLFQPATMNIPALIPFQYTHDKHIKFEIPKTPDERRLNIREWLEFGNHAFDSTDIWVLQYNTSADSFRQALSDPQHSKYKDNSFLQWLLKKENKQALRYFVFAKKVEGAQNPYWENQWDQLFRNTLVETMDSLANEGYRLFKKERNRFLKTRYAFQYVKCAYYAGYYGNGHPDTKAILKVFKRYLSKTASIVGQWAWIYYADLQQDPIERTRHFLNAFATSDDKKVRAYQLLNNEDLDALIQIEKSTEIKAIALALSIIREQGPALDKIQSLYRLKPDQAYIPLLLSREINKLEDWLWSPEILRFQPNQRLNEYYTQYYRQASPHSPSYKKIAKEQWQKDREYLNRFLSFLLELQGEHPPYTHFLALAIAHIYNMDHRHTEAINVLNKLPANLDPNSQLQFYIENVIALSQLPEIQSRKDYKSKLANLIQKIRIVQNKILPEIGSAEAEYSENKFPELLAYLGRQFLTSGDKLSGCLLLQKSDLLLNEYAYAPFDSTSYGGIAYLEKYASPRDIDGLLQLKHKHNKTRFEQLISPETWLTDGMYLDLKGTLLLRNEAYEAALDVFNQLEDDFWETTYAFKEYLPEMTVTALEENLPVSSGTGLIYRQIGKKSVLREMVKLKRVWKSANDPEEKARAGFHFANALFNISFYGRGWMVSAYGKSASEPRKRSTLYMTNYKWVYYYMPETGYNKPENYYGLQHALKMYRDVAGIKHVNRELQAEVTWMLMLCDRLNRQYFTNKTSSENSGTGHRPSPYLDLLKSKYTNTRFFTAAQTHCPDIF